MEDYCFVPIPVIGLWYYRHDFIRGGHKWPICGTTETVIGIRGEQLLEAGFIFAPYIPMVLEGEFQPRQSISSRYATKVVNPNFYGRITVNEPYNGVQLPKVNRVFV